MNWAIKIILKTLMTKISNISWGGYGKGFYGKLIDAEGLSNYYNLTVNVIDALKYQPIISNRILIYYPKVEIIDISKLLTQSINHTYTVKILENTHIVKWASYDPTNQTIKFSNYNQDGYGAHNLTISIYDDWFSRNFDSTIVVVISLPHPPATTGTISNITAYQGQEVIKIQINEGVFFDESETYLVALSLWTEFADKFNQNAILDSYILPLIYKVNLFHISTI